MYLLRPWNGFVFGLQHQAIEHMEDLFERVAYLRGGPQPKLAQFLWRVSCQKAQVNRLQIQPEVL